MSTTCLITFLLLLTIAYITSCNQQDLEVVQMARTGVQNAMNWARATSKLHGLDQDLNYVGVALGDCVKLNEETEPRLAGLVSGESFSWEDAVAWLSGALASHRSCLDGLEEKGWLFEAQLAQNLTVLLGESLAFYGH
ncbi:hypothetical protein ACSBR1_017211 [Camellia fascicularis]